MPEVTASDVSLRRLLYFVALDDHGSYGAAARHLGLTVPTLWRQVKQLEDQLGLLLVEPGDKTEPAQVTEAGKRLAEQARKTLASSEALVAFAAELREPGPLCVSGYPAHISVVLAELEKRLCAEGIEALVDERIGDHERAEWGRRAVADLQRMALDLVIAPELSHDEELSFDVLYTWELVAVTDFVEELRSSEPIALSELIRWPLLMSPEQHSSHRLLVQAAEKIEQEPNFKMTNTSVQVLLGMGEAGRGVPVLPADALAPFPHISHARPVLGGDGVVLADRYHLYYRTADLERPDLQRARALAYEILAARNLRGVEPAIPKG